MTKKGGGTGERNFNRKKVKVNTIVARQRKNKKLQTGRFNVNVAALGGVTSKKMRREARKVEKKQEKKERNRRLKEEKMKEMKTETVQEDEWEDVEDGRAIEEEPMGSK